MAKRSFNGEVREILKDAAKEMGFAVDSIRKEVIEKGWFDQGDLTPEVADRWAREEAGEPEAGIAGSQDFSRDATREDLYGRDIEAAGRALNEHGVTHDPDNDNQQSPDHGLDRDQDLER